MHTRMPVMMSLLLAMSAAPAMWAQNKPKGSLSGTVRSAGGIPVADVLVRVLRDSTVYIARSDEDGRFLVTSLPAGEYTVVAKRIGFDSTVSQAVVADTRVRTELALTERSASTDTIRVRGAFTGVTGIVGDFAQMSPLDSATVRVLGGEQPLVTTTDGRFAIELKPGRSYALRIERRGFAPQIASIEMLSEQRVELAVLLDSASRNIKDAWKWQELDQRQRVNNFGSAHVARSELRETEATNLQLALQYAPSVTAKGMSIPRRACVFVDGVARPTLSVDAIPVESVEFVEVYAQRAEVSGTLATRWPVGYACALQDNLTDRGVFTTSRGASTQAQYVLIWTRSP